jgi:hypothetical protein
MKIAIPFLPIEIEITARRRTRPFRIRVRTLLIMVAIVAFTVYLLLPFSAADRDLMARYERIGDNQPKDGLTKAQVISQIGAPSAASIPTPNMCADYTWVAHFDRPLSHQVFELGLSIDPDTDLVAAWGLDKKEYQGLDLIRFRIGRCLEKIGF